MRPLYAKLFVEKDPEETIHKTGMIIPDSAKDKPETGTVILAGHGRLLASGEVIPLQVKVGDPIIFAKWAGIRCTTSSAKAPIILFTRSWILIQASRRRPAVRNASSWKATPWSPVCAGC